MKMTRRPVGPCTKKGFTLIELLVVIAIIALLLSILMPALSRVKEQTRRVICGTNLHQYGIMVHSYAADNDGAVMSTPMFGLDNKLPFPDHWFGDMPSNLPDKSDNFNIPAINAYMEAFTFGPPAWDEIANLPDETDHLYATNVSICPAVNKKFYSGLANSYYQSSVKQGFQPTHIQFCFAYYGRVDRWKGSAMNKANRELVGNSLVSNRILMGDAIRWTPTSTTDRDWNYSHGKYGWANHFNSKASYADSGEPELSGINQLYGDNHLEWKRASTMNTPLMGTNAFRGGHVDYGNMALVWYYASPSAFTKPPGNVFP